MLVVGGSLSEGLLARKIKDAGVKEVVSTDRIENEASKFFVASRVVAGEICWGD